MVYQRVAELDDLWSGEKLGLLVGGRPVILIRLDDVVYAYTDACLHKRARLSEGSLRDGRLRCGAHAWEYEVTTGACVNPKGRALRRYPVELREGGVWIDTDAPEPGECHG